eukprot:3787209-Pleurochrysis_carterae.AAC.1
MREPVGEAPRLAAREDENGAAPRLPSEQREDAPDTAPISSIRMRAELELAQLVRRSANVLGVHHCCTAGVPCDGGVESDGDETGSTPRAHAI